MGVGVVLVNSHCPEGKYVAISSCSPSSVDDHTTQIIKIAISLSDSLNGLLSYLPPLSPSLLNSIFRLGKLTFLPRRTKKQHRNMERTLLFLFRFTLNYTTSIARL